MQEVKSRYGSATKIGVLVCTLALPRQAAAQPAPEPGAAALPAAPSAEQPDPCLSDPRCKELVRSARTLSQLGQYEAACLAYKLAYARQGSPWLLINIGRMQQKLGLKEAAGKNYELYLATLRSGEDQDARQRTIDFLAELRQEPPLPIKSPPASDPTLASPDHESSSGSPTSALRRLQFPYAVLLRPTHEPRPTWRLALGGTLLLLGAAAVGAGGAFLGLHGKCADSRCNFVWDTSLLFSAPLLTIGLTALGSGALSIGLPGPLAYKPVLQRPPSALGEGT